MSTRLTPERFKEVTLAMLESRAFRAQLYAHFCLSPGPNADLATVFKEAGLTYKEVLDWAFSIRRSEDDFDHLHSRR